MDPEKKVDADEAVGDVDVDDSTDREVGRSSEETEKQGSSDTDEEKSSEEEEPPELPEYRPPVTGQRIFQYNFFTVYPSLTVPDRDRRYDEIMEEATRAWAALSQRQRDAFDTAATKISDKRTH